MDLKRSVYFHIVRAKDLVLVAWYALDKRERIDERGKAN